MLYKRGTSARKSLIISVSVVNRLMFRPIFSVPALIQFWNREMNRISGSAKLCGHLKAKTIYKTNANCEQLLGHTELISSY